MFKRLLPCVGLLALAAFTPSVRAQVANGPWNVWSPSYVLQLVGSGANSGSTFTISSTSTTTEQRAERRYTIFSSGSKQFQGTVKVNSLGGDRISLKQTFQDGTGPWNIIAVKKPGSLYEVEGGAVLAAYTIGTNVTINTCTYTGTDHVTVYVNGSKVEDITGGAGTYYDKLGVYRTNSGHGPVSATWSNIKFWQR